MKPVSLLALCINLVFGTISYAAVPISQQPVFDDSNAPPALHTEKNRILDVNGNDVILRGVWFSDGVERDKYDSAVVKNIRHQWNANVIRLPILAKRWLEEPNYPVKYVDEIVRATGENGMYIIIDWHAHGNPFIKGKIEVYDPNLTLTTKALKTIVSRYAKCRWVLYNIFNEPAHITWNEWRPVAEKLTDAVHSVNPGAITFISGVDWSHDLTGVLDNPVNRKNIVYEIHTYPASRDPNDVSWKITISQIAKRYPVIIGEWGYVENEQQLTVSTRKALVGTTRGYAVSLLDFAQKLNIGWTAYTYSCYWEPSLVSYYGDLIDGAEILTRAGFLVREALNNRPYHDTSAAWRQYLTNQHSLMKNNFSEIDPNLFAYGKAVLDAHIRSNNYNQLGILLQKPAYNSQQLPVSFFEFKLGYDLQTSDFRIDMREGMGISDTTKWGITDKWGRVLMIRINNDVPRQYPKISAMTRQDQLILKGILGNISNIIKDALLGDNKLSEEDKTFWRGKIPFFATRSTMFIQSVEGTQPSD